MDTNINKIDDIIAALDDCHNFQYKIDDHCYTFKHAAYLSMYTGSYIVYKTENINFCIIRTINKNDDIIENAKAHFISKGFLFIFYSSTEHEFFTTISNQKCNIPLTIDNNDVLKAIEINLRQNTVSTEQLYDEIEEKSKEYFQKYRNYNIKSALEASKNKESKEIQSYIINEILYSLDYLEIFNKYNQDN